MRVLPVLGAGAHADRPAENPATEATSPRTLLRLHHWGIEDPDDGGDPWANIV